MKYIVVNGLKLNEIIFCPLEPRFALHNAVKKHLCFPIAGNAFNALIFAYIQHMWEGGA